jgi:hypothetical protein
MSEDFFSIDKALNLTFFPEQKRELLRKIKENKGLRGGVHMVRRTSKHEV